MFIQKYRPHSPSLKQSPKQTDTKIRSNLFPIPLRDCRDLRPEGVNLSSLSRPKAFAAIDIRAGCQILTLCFFTMSPDATERDKLCPYPFIYMNYKKIFKIFPDLLGDKQTQTFENRTFNTAMLSISIAGLTLLSYDIILGNIASQFIDISCIAYSISCYIYSIKNRNHYKLTTVTFIFLYIAISSGWFFNNGIHGGMPFFFFVLSCYSGVFFKKPFIHAIPFIIATVSLLTAIEFLNPELVISYKSKVHNFLDIGASIIICLVINGISIHIIYKKYDIERELNKKMLNKAINDKELIENSIKEIQILQGLLPICSHCKKIRDEQGEWRQLERFIQENSEAEFSHSLCPECAQTIYPEFIDKMNFWKKNDLAKSKPTQSKNAIQEKTSSTLSKLQCNFGGVTVKSIVTEENHQ